MSDALKSNTTLTKLNLRGEYKRKKTHKRHPSTIHFFMIITSTDNKIRDIGTTSLSEALKSNTKLTTLNMWSEDKRKTHKRYPPAIHFFSILITSTDNYIEETGATSLSDALKSNTTLTKLSFGGEYKKRMHTKDIHQQITLFPFSSHQQTTGLETQEQHH